MKCWAVRNRKTGRFEDSTGFYTKPLTAMAEMFSIFDHPQLQIPEGQFNARAFWDAWLEYGYDKKWEIVQVDITTTDSVYKGPK